MSRKVFKTIISLLVFLLLPSITFAAPSINSIEGVVLNNSSVTITGTDFGVKSPAKPLLWAPFEESINPSNLGIITSWDEIGSMEYDADEGTRGTGVAKASDSSGIWVLGIDTAGSINWNDFGQKYYLSRKVKINFVIGNKNWKGLRVWGTNFVYPDYYTQLGESMNLMNVESSGNGMGTCGYLTNGDVARNNQLNNFAVEEMIVRSNSAQDVMDSQFLWTSNGEVVTNDTSCDFDREAGAMTLMFPVHGVIANEAMASNDRTWYDDVYLNTTWSRIVICNGSTWLNHGICEVQIPSAWTTSSASVMINQGSFPDNSSQYLYVLDSTGTANTNGFPITFGSGSTPVIRSDVDNSSATNTTDALLTLRNSLGISMASTAWVNSTTTGDVDCSGTSNSTDALLILRYSLGLSMNGTIWCEG